ncbi:putative RNA methyltransferase [Candidatus Nitrososphaera gargensis Ga9.2]|uniref:Putative RNA methyltransferase n=1 Tax=Nitrososphaera gargensis (strain Ga9.2) TaxID=1237085 RepID=K0IL06_NITGG|nr:RNA methyltransferase [Candidatus Nitrososphaera gargensis]AFU60088.1 putative RNA methyltransferase [Candidatus Nitrososphaera gargensis Ga9.2]
MVIAVALVEPQYHVNVGHVARLMENFGLKRLYFIKPHFDRVEALKYSTHGKDVLETAKTATLKQLRKKFDILIGTTAIPATSRLNVLREATGAEQIAKIIHSGDGKNFCIVLGRESSGLNNEELAMCDLVVIIDTKTKYRTMNIAHALAIMLYEISKLKPELPVKKSKKKIDLASQQDIDLLLHYVGKVADAGNYDAHKKPLLEAAVKKMLAKSVPTTKDVMLMVSLLRRSLLAIERRKRRAEHA